MRDGAASGRIVSMDQFRGYTVAGMFVVNFLGSFSAIHAIWKHNNNYFSYADSIMPSFMFAVGFSFRLTYLRRRHQYGPVRTAWTYVRRALELIVLSLVMYGFGGGFKHWDDFSQMPAEFEPFRAKASTSKSFDLLLSEAQKQNPGSDMPTLIHVAAKIGEMSKEGKPKKQADEARYQFSQKTADEAIQEGDEFVRLAIDRKHDWESLDKMGKFLVHWRIFGAKLLKSDLWETLALIGVTQLVVLPWIGCRFGTRLAALVGLGAVHTVITYWFNWDFLYGINDNWMSKLWMTGTNRSWDGGFFGPISWGIAMMAGTLAYDLVAGSATPKAAAVKLLLWGAAFMAVGYAASCLTRLYERSGEELVQMRERHLRQNAEKAWLGNVIERQEASLKERRKPLEEKQGAINEQKRNDFLAVYKELRNQPENAGISNHVLADRAERQQRENPRANPKLDELNAQLEKLEQDLQPELDRLEGTITVLRDQQNRYPNLELAESPVWPPWERLKGHSLRDVIVEPPFVAPPRDDSRVDPEPHIEHRQWNYWTMSKRLPTFSFMTFATGFAFALYGLFVVACDSGGLMIGVFRTFGTNALVAYFLHHVVGEAVEPLVPHDAQLWFTLTAFALFFWLTYVLVRYLEKRNIFLKL